MKTGKVRRTGRNAMLAMVIGTAAFASLGSTAEANTAVAGEAVQDISRYCSACWRNARLPVDRWSDCTQEVFRRLLERVPPEGWSHVLTRDTEQRREFLRAIDAVKKQTQREKRGLSYLDAVTDRKDAAESDLRQEREVLQTAADAVLSDRQQRILQLTCEGWSIPEIADAMSVSCDRVSDEKYKAIRKLRQHFESHPELS